MRGRRRACPDYHRRVLRIRSLRLARALKPAGVLAILLALGSVVVAAPAAAATTRDVAVIVVPGFDPGAYADKGAVGLFVPGAGSTVSRERALASLVRGRVISSLVHLDGDEILRLSEAPAATTIYVALPPPGSQHNVVRYPVAIVGSGYSGLLRSESTRIDGLVSLADIAPSALALARGEDPPITARSDADPAATLERLDGRLTRAHDAREGATLVLVGWMVGLALVGLLARSATAGRAARPGRARCPCRRAPRTSSRHRRTTNGRGDPGDRDGHRVDRPRSSARDSRPRGRGDARAVPHRARGMAGGQRARRDRAPSGRRGPLLRRHEPGGHARARAGSRGCGLARRRRGGRDRAAARS